ncbi:MAG: hypothetical protein U0871_00280 [Gemmataceae bacterium]
MASAATRGLCLTTALILAGCDRQEAIPDRHPLTGTVVRAGRPVTAGGLIFLPIGRSSGLVVNAPVRPDGTFTAETSRTRPAGGVDVFPGVPAGRYTAVYHPPSDGQKTGLEVQLGEITVPAGGTAVTLTLPDKLPEGNGMPRDDAPDAAAPKKD